MANDDTPPDRPEDQRQDEQTRGRIDELLDSWEEATHRLDRRYRHVALIVASMMIITLIVGAFAWKSNSDRVDDVERLSKINSELIVGLQETQNQLRTERYRASFLACLRSNAQSQANLGFLARLGVPERVIEQARGYYPIVPDCEKYVTDLYGPRPPKGAFEVPPDLVPNLTPTPTPSDG